MSDSKAMSISELERMVRHSFHELMKATYPLPSEDEGYWSCPYWILDIYTEGYCIVQDDAMGAYYRINFSIAGDMVTFDAKEQWQAVEKEWLVKSGVDLTSVYIGGTVKALGDGKIAGFIVQYTSDKQPDLVGDFFDAKSDLDMQTGDRLSVYYEHGKDSVLKNRKIGQGTVTMQDAGAWFEAQLNRSDAYEEYVYKLAEMGKLGWSTGPAQHLIRKSPEGKAIHIDAWPVKDATLSVSPAEYRNRAIPLKSLPHEELKFLVNPTQGVSTQEVGKSDAYTATSTSEHIVNIAFTFPETAIEIPLKSKDKEPMADNEDKKTVPDENARLDGLEASVKNISDGMVNLLKALEKTPKGEGEVYTNIGGAADKNVKSLGDFALAIYRGDQKRLKSVYPESFDMKALQEDQGTTGGYRVPPQFSGELVVMQQAMSPIVGLCRRFPVQGPAGTMPVLDIYATPTAGAGNTALAAGLISSTIAEGGAYTDRNVNFEIINWRVVKVGDRLNVSDEMMQDAPQIDALLRTVIATHLSQKKERHILRGTGVGQPLGILNSPALVNVTPGTDNAFSWVDATTMLSRFRPFSGEANRIRWAMHRSLIPDLGNLQVASGTAATFVQNLSASMANLPLLQYPIEFSEHLPQANSSGDALLCDFGGYALWERGEIRIDFSVHAGWNTGEVVWRFDERYDGQPIARAAVTQADPTGSFTTSNFVNHND